MYRITVPATSANLGAGFDCFGIALELKNIIEFEVVEKGLKIELGPGYPASYYGADNLVVRTISETLKSLDAPMPGLRLRQHNGIPVSRGLGSSAACRVAGVAAAGIIAKKVLDANDIIRIATRFERHPDNIAAATLGGFTIARAEAGEIRVFRLPPPKGLRCCAFIPDFTMNTDNSRKTLPAMVSREDAVFNIAQAATFAAALATGDYDNLTAADKLHQPYRSPHIPGYDGIIAKSFEYGAKAAFLSGGGPSLLALIRDDNKDFGEKMRAYVKTLGKRWDVVESAICGQGIAIEEI